MLPLTSPHTRFMHGIAKSENASTSSRPEVARPRSMLVSVGHGSRSAVQASASGSGPPRRRARLGRRRAERAVDDRPVVGLPDLERFGVLPAYADPLVRELHRPHLALA